MEFDFQSIKTGHSSKMPVRSRLNTQFIKLGFQNSIFQKSSADPRGGSCTYFTQLNCPKIQILKGI